ncbi:hypothetical protein RND81_01G127300 [Saponaria officinalis]|uniref:Uncharacterized protein n=1 Tax=Saponaria officinalis TaxID=3572 RepID=A0AAW1NF60_SAPOF
MPATATDSTSTEPKSTAATRPATTVHREQMGDRGNDVMVFADRTFDRKITASMGQGPNQVVARPPPRRRPQRMVSSSKAAPVVSEDLEREIRAGFEEHLHDDDHSDDEEVDGEQEGDDVFLENQASESPLPKRVIRDDRGRYVRCGDSSCSTGRKKAKRDLSWRLTGAVLGGPSHCNVLRSFGGHVAFSSWSDPENVRPWIKCYERSGCLEEMNGIRLYDAVSRRVSESGLGHLRHCMITNLDENLISAFVER